jgi:hypothetical protein
MDNHDDYVDGERAMRQGQMQNPYMMAGSMGMPGQFNGYGGMGNMAGMAPGQMPGAPGAMGWQGGRQDQGAFRQQGGPPGSRAGPAAQVCVCVCVCPKREREREFVRDDTRTTTPGLSRSVARACRELAPGAVWRCGAILRALTSLSRALSLPLSPSLSLSLSSGRRRGRQAPCHRLPGVNGRRPGWPRRGWGEPGRRFYGWRGRNG